LAARARVVDRVSATTRTPWSALRWPAWSTASIMLVATGAFAAHLGALPLMMRAPTERATVESVLPPSPSSDQGSPTPTVKRRTARSGEAPWHPPVRTAREPGRRGTTDPRSDARTAEALLAPGLETPAPSGASDAGELGTESQMLAHA